MVLPASEGMQITSLPKHTEVAIGEIPWVQLVAMEMRVLYRDVIAASMCSFV